MPLFVICEIEANVEILGDSPLRYAEVIFFSGAAVHLSLPGRTK